MTQNGVNGSNQEAPVPVLRSLVAHLSEGEEIAVTLRRNLSRDDLVTAYENRDTLWIDVTDPSDSEILWLEEVFNLHPAVVSDLRREDNRPALLIYPEYIFVSIFQGRIVKNGVESDEIHCLIGETFFITVRTGTSTSINGAYDRAAQNVDYWRRGATYMLYLAMQFLIDSYYPLLDRVSNQLNKLEEQAMSGGGKALTQPVFKVKQQLINLRQMVAPQREVISNVIGEERLSKTSENRDLFRHLYERLLRIYDVIDSQRDLAGNVLDLIESQESSHLGMAVSRLTVISMVFLPMTFLISMFGLNFVTTEPELRIPLGGGIVFALLFLVSIIFGIGLVYFFRKRGWL